MMILRPSDDARNGGGVDRATASGTEPGAETAGRAARIDMTPAGAMMLRRFLSIAALFVSHTTAAYAQAPTLRARLQYTFRPHAGILRQLAFSPDGRLLATSSVDHTVKLWRLGDGHLTRTLVHPEGVTSVAFSADGQWLASGSYDGSVSLWRLRDGTLARRLAAHTGTVWSVAFSPDGAHLASSGEDKVVRIWRTDDGAPERTLAGHSLNVWSVAFSPDGRLLASGSFDHTVKLWRADSGTVLRTLTEPTEAVVHIDISPDGELLAGGGDDSAIRLWRLRDGALLQTLTGGSNHVYTVAFSADGGWLASGGREKGAFGTLAKEIGIPALGGGRRPTVRLWRVRDGALQAELADHADDVWSVAFSPDGHWLASASADGTVQLHRLEVAP